MTLFIVEDRFRSESSALAKLENIDSAEKARMFTNVDVYFPTKYAPSTENNELTWDFFVGCQIIDIKAGLLGNIVEVDNTTINTLFVVETPGGNELLLPAQEDFILNLDQENKIITVDLPDGLIYLDSLEVYD